MYKKTKNHIDTTIKFLISMSYSLKTDEISINQKILGQYLNLKRETINRQLNKLIKLNLLSIERQQYFNTNKDWKKKPNWKNNIYKVDKDKLNNYLIEKYNYNCLDNIDTDINLYINYIVFYKEYFMEEKVKVRHIKRRLNKINRLVKANRKYIDILNDLNNDTDRKIKMSYITDNKKRLTSKLCHTYNPKTHTDDTKRYKLLVEQYGNVEYDEFDTNASIYRLTYNLNHTEYLSPDIDIYELIYNNCNFTVNWSDSIRKLFKKLLMGIYMREWGITYRCFEYDKKKHYKVFYKKSDKDFVDFYNKITTTFNDNLNNILTTVANAMHKVLNVVKFYKADIFIYESNLHIIMLKKKKEDNIIASNVYDGFYIPKGTISNEQFNNYYNQATNILKGVCV